MADLQKLVDDSSGLTVMEALKSHKWGVRQLRLSRQYRSAGCRGGGTGGGADGVQRHQPELATKNQHDRGSPAPSPGLD